MTTLSLLIGTDTSLESVLGDDGVYVESRGGDVSIVGPFEGWAGYKLLAEFDRAEDGEALARKIAGDPAAELDALGYDRAAWFQPSR